MKRFYGIIIAIIMLANTICAAEAKAVKQYTMLELRELQTRTYDSADTMRVTKAVINTLQDNGFIILNMEPELGYIRAVKEVKLKRTLKGRLALFYFNEMVYALCLAASYGMNPSAVVGMYQTGVQIKNEIAPHTVIFDSNVNITPFGKRTKVRFNVIEKVLENGDGYTTVKSSPRKVVRHYEADMYQEFFSQVDKNLFFENNLL